MTLIMSKKIDEFYRLKGHQNERETIHSGQFMVSHFEAEAQEEEDDNEIKMLDPDDPAFEKITDINYCTDVQRYEPKSPLRMGSSTITTKVEIETSLAKLFKCMNLAYSQKLTSPKWNHFKGVRLRWKDKIRLNNVIWRCWHMQFILRKKTPVCQFASPLDVDIHNNPQSVVLEGKYWKRQLSVIKAEYRKWRRNYKTKTIGYSLWDSKSEFDFLEWSPLNNDRNLMITDDWTSDTLFSAINVPFPFPDPREIARGAGIADFIQPSLGPLQPNLDDIDINTFQELLQNSRLPPVPEEQSEDILKSVECVFAPIIESGTINPLLMTNTQNVCQDSNIINPINDASMMELNTPIDSLQYSSRSFDDAMTLDSSNLKNIQNTNMISSLNFQCHEIDGIQSQSFIQPKLLNDTASNFGLQNIITPNIDENILEMQCTGQGINYAGKSILKGRIGKQHPRPFRKREPHNYEKAQPTSHQTSIYQQILAEQKKQEHLASIQQNSLLITTNTNTNSNNQILLYTSNPISSEAVKLSPSTSIVTQQNIPASILNTKFLPQSNIFYNINEHVEESFKQNLTNQSTNSIFGDVSESKKYTWSTGDYTPIPTKSSIQNLTSTTFNPFILEQNQNITEQSAREIFRSNSLPSTSSKFIPIQTKEENFIKPKIQQKPVKSRVRSNSMQLNNLTKLNSSQLQTAASEPMLNSTLAQLLTMNSTNKFKNNHSTSTSSLIPASNSLPPLGIYSSSDIQSKTIKSSYSLPPIRFDNQNITRNLPSTSNEEQQKNNLNSPNSITSALLLQSPSRSQLISYSPSNLTPNTSLSPESFVDPESPLSPTTSNSKYTKDTQRRAGHIHAEQKRRFNIKNGFDVLYSLIPQFHKNPNTKLSKAAMLQKGAEYIKQLRAERNLINAQMEALRKERESLNNSLAQLHSILPANGGPVLRQRTERVQQLYTQFVRYKAMENWKFWIFGLILETLMSSYTATVSIGNIEELYRTALLWVDKHCSLVELRPAVSNKLRYLSMTTDVLSDPPSTLHDEVIKALNNTDDIHPNLSGS